MNLVEFIQDAERKYFRTESDTGANPNAMFVWNRVREYAGLPILTRENLFENHAALTGESIEEIKEGRVWLERYRTWRNDTDVLRKYGVPQKYWPASPLDEKD